MTDMDAGKRLWVQVHLSYLLNHGELDEMLTLDEVRDLAHNCDVRDRRQKYLRKACLSLMAARAVEKIMGRSNE